MGRKMKSDFQTDLHHTIPRVPPSGNDAYELERSGKVSDCNRAFDETYFEELFLKCDQYSQGEKYALYCGRIWCDLFLQKDTDILEWYTMIHRVFEKSYRKGRMDL